MDLLAEINKLRTNFVERAQAANREDDYRRAGAFTACAAELQMLVERAEREERA